MRLYVMKQVLVQCEQSACGQIERPAFGSHEDMAGDGLGSRSDPLSDAEKPSTGFQCGEDDRKVVMLDERPGVLSAVPLRSP